MTIKATRIFLLGLCAANILMSTCSTLFKSSAADAKPDDSAVQSTQTSPPDSAPQSKAPPEEAASEPAQTASEHPQPAPAAALLPQAPAEETAPAKNVDSLKNTIWQLTELRIGVGSIMLDRTLMTGNQMNDYFTLQFVNEGISGRAAPNRYFAPYALLDGNNLMIRPIAGTLMSPLTTIGVLNEDRYYALLQNITHWDSKDNILHLYIPAEKEGIEVVMVYKPQ
ncbi:MAG: META domain-containing protein [Spirochaetaceae bacterium]|nr:META domain-containing protein [Spirochaetaceae bacterium]